MSFFANPILIRSCRIVLGALLIVAGLAKIGGPEAFARQIENFDVLPIGSENLLAIVIPWIEVVAGLALMAGVRARSAAWLGLGLMLVFDIAVVQAMARGLDIECGCFGTASATRVGLAKLGENLALTALAALGSFRLR
jgi:uncharacterized membrane protein YphA (DoxX/SURF4 family)